MNPEIDAVRFEHAGRTVTIRVSWRVLKVLQRDWGDAWRERFIKALDQEIIDDLTEIVALITCMAPEDVMEWSPPTAPIASAIFQAYALTRTGEKPAEASEANENPLKARSILSTASAALRFVRGLAGPTSGNKPLTPPAST